MILFLFLSPVLAAQEWGSWKVIESSREPAAGKVKHGDRLSSSMIRFYQQKVSPRQGKRCPAYPSCSAFTMDAISRYGFAMGFIMGVDRMYFRENFDMKYLKHYYPVVIKSNIKRVYDPVEANFIFSRKRRDIIDPAASQSW